ncbi:MAG: helix-hairpin-helix domain-containing protein [Bacteroidetes bacterium]|nr:helix-hairpin-helix domain-containing protein [Bacteroidota bacterium]
MKQVIIGVVCMIQTGVICAQEIPAETEQQIESLLSQSENGTEDDQIIQGLEKYKRSPLNINIADASALRTLQVITDLQIDNLIAYRHLLGMLTSIYELQAVPSWDLYTIQRIRPFISVSISLPIRQEMESRFRKGEHMVLFKISQVLEKASGYRKDSTNAGYLGSPQQVVFRYRYQYKDLLQWGITGDKDAGESFLKGAQRMGFDFYSAHLFIRKAGPFSAIALGDYTVSLGQGLIQWQGMAFKKSAEITAIKRQSSVLRPYNSTGEFYFSRGAGFSLQAGKYECTTFFSFRKLNANRTLDSTENYSGISSLLSSGYNRTFREAADRHTVSQTMYGLAISRNTSRLKIGLNGIMYQYSLPFSEKEEPYQLYTIRGKKWFNASMDYSYTFRNIHLFGELAAAMNRSVAMVNGLLISVDPKADIAILHRRIGEKYQAVYGNAFTENTNPNNENGLFAGISLRPAAGWKLDAYTDLFRFPWLKYRVNGPSGGADYFVQVTRTPNKQVELYTRFSVQIKERNEMMMGTSLAAPEKIRVYNWLMHMNYQVNQALGIRTRVETKRFQKKYGEPEHGFLAFFDLRYKPLMTWYSAVIRLQYFETESYDARIYAYENDVLYSYSIPANSGRGYRYYVLLNADLNRSLSCWLRFSQSIFPEQHILGTQLDAIKGSNKSEINLQFLLKI